MAGDLFEGSYLRIGTIVIPLALVFEGEFSHGEHLRWNLGWATPNYAGALLITLLCFAWVVRGNSRWRAAAFAAEAAGYFLLAETCSRGAVVALCAAAVFFVAAQGWERWRTSWRVWTLRLLFVTACVVGTGLGSRMDPRNLSEDGAVTHRLDLWRGGLEMIVAAPWRGWGAGESGRAYMDWFEGVDRTEGFSTMVNSYLHVGVELGLPILGGVMCGLAGLLMLAWQISRKAGPERYGTEGPADRPFAFSAVQSFGLLMPAAGASLVAWAVANVFTTLWIEPKLWIVPAVSGTFIGLGSWCCREGIRWRWVSSVSVSSAFLTVGGLFVAGALSRTGQTWRPEPGEGGTIVLRSREMPRRKSVHPTNAVWYAVQDAGAPGQDLIIWTDKVVLGEFPGKEIRRWADTLHGPRRIMACDPRLVGEGGVIASANATWVLTGDQCRRLALAPAGADVVLLHPRGRPPVATRKRLILVLPEFDQEGTNTIWQSWAKEGGDRIVFSPQTGEDIRSAWPAVMTTVCEQLAARGNAP